MREIAMPGENFYIQECFFVCGYNSFVYNITNRHAEWNLFAETDKRF